VTSPTEILREEHVLILRALAALEVAAARLAAGGALPPRWWDGMLGWLGAFADRGHHAKEEQALFPALIKAGAPAGGGPVDVMREEHARGRALIRDMADGEPARRAAAAAHEYVGLLRQHIDKENDVLFPLADALLDEGDRWAVRQEFEAVEADLGREGSMATAAARLDELAAALGGAPQP
jgi:hemerythrin-like domain-containing protein